MSYSFGLVAVSFFFLLLSFLSISSPLIIPFGSVIRRVCGERVAKISICFDRLAGAFNNLTKGKEEKKRVKEKEKEKGRRRSEVEISFIYKSQPASTSVIRFLRFALSRENLGDPFTDRRSAFHFSCLCDSCESRESGGTYHIGHGHERRKQDRCLDGAR